MKLQETLRSVLLEVASMDDVQRAIKQKQVVTIFYDGDEPGGRGIRTIEPVCLGFSKSGNRVLRAWDMEGASHTARTGEQPLPGWRLFRLDKIMTFKPTGDNFTTPRPGYNFNGDKSMTRVIIKHNLTTTMNNDLMQKWAISKQIMDASDNIKPGQTQGSLPMSENINATYNIPQDMLQSVPQQNVPQQQMVQGQTMSQPQPVTEDKIQKSNLPDEIKQLMMEHPIQQPGFGGGGPVLSNDVIEGVQRLMGKTPQQPVNENVSTQSSSNNGDLKQMIRDVVRDTVRDVVREELQNSGMLTEGNTKVNESLQLRVGKHVFEGRVTKIKKVK